LNEAADPAPGVAAGLLGFLPGIAEIVRGARRRLVCACGHLAFIRGAGLFATFDRRQATELNRA
jgi:hypothetical protein